MSIRYYTISIATGASVSNAASLVGGFDWLKAEIPTFEVADTSAVVAVYGAGTSGGTYRPIVVANPSSATTGPPVPAMLGIGSTVGNLIMDLGPAIGVPFLKFVLVNTVTTGSMEVRVFGGKLY